MNTQSQFYIRIGNEGKNEGERPREFTGLELRGLIHTHISLTIGMGFSLI